MGRVVSGSCGVALLDGVAPMRPRRPAVHAPFALPTLAAFVLLAGCWDSYQQYAAADGAIPSHDDAADDDAGPATWRFVDTDIPDRIIPTTPAFRPQQVSLAWNGSVAGLLACGYSSSDDATRTVFRPLDARGAPAGDEMLVFGRTGLGCAVSPIAVEPEGTFLVSIQADTSSGHVVVLRLAADGALLARGELGVRGPLRRPTGPPAVAGDSVFVTTATEGDFPSIDLLRFDRRHLSPNGQSVVGPSDGLVDDPQAVTAPGGTRVLVFYLHNHETLRCESCTSDVPLSCTDFATVDWPVPVGGFSAATNGTDWFAFAHEHDVEVSELRLYTASSRSESLEERIALMTGDRWSSGPVAGTAADRPAWGSVLPWWNGSQAAVHASLTAEPSPGVVVHDLLALSDVETEEPHGRSDSAALAWTGAGFLIVWSRDSTTLDGHAIASSFVELVRD